MIDWKVSTALNRHRASVTAEELMEVEGPSPNSQTNLKLNKISNLLYSFFPYVGHSAVVP